MINGIFIYKTLNSSSRNKDASKIDTLGPFAAGLSIILYGAERDSMRPGYFPSRHSNLPAILLYRGLKLSREEIDQYKGNKGQMINMNGYSSTSFKKDEAI